MGCSQSRQILETEEYNIPVGRNPTLHVSRPELVSERVSDVDLPNPPLAKSTTSLPGQNPRFSTQPTGSEPIASSPNSPSRRISLGKVTNSRLHSSRRSWTNRLSTNRYTEDEAETQSNQIQLSPAFDAVNGSLSRNIAAVMALLREMYSLDIKVYGSKLGRRQDVGARNRQIGEADLLFRSIMDTLESWETFPYEYGWTKEELDVIKEIREIAVKNDPSKHRKAQPYGITAQD